MELENGLSYSEHDLQQICVWSNITIKSEYVVAI